MQDTGIKLQKVFKQPHPTRITKRKTIIEFPALKYFTGIKNNPHSVGKDVMFDKPRG